jgi:hypothetical protein
MITATFNAITYANKLKKAGLDVKIADVQAEEMSEMINSTLATKEDLKIFKFELQAFIVKSLIAVVGILGGLQTLFHFVK